MSLVVQGSSMMLIAVGLLLFPAPTTAEVPSANQFQAQRRQVQAHDYGPLGNVLARVLSTTKKTDQQQPQAKVRDYGPLGNLFAHLATLTLSTVGRSAESAKGTPSSDEPAVEPGKANSVLLHAGTCAKPTNISRGSSTSAQALKGARDLLKMLWSNFLPDPTFDRAIVALMQRDQHIGMDSAEGEGGFITAAQKRLILSRTNAEDGRM